MVQRNYVAKYAQRSGAGKHKRKDRIMDQHYDNIHELEDHLEQYEKQVFEDTSFVLSHIMEVMNHLYKGDTGKAYDGLEFLVDIIHTQDERARASEFLKERYNGSV